MKNNVYVSILAAIAGFFVCTQPVFAMNPTQDNCMDTRSDEEGDSSTLSTSPAKKRKQEEQPEATAHCDKKSNCQVVQRIVKKRKETNNNRLKNSLQELSISDVSSSCEENKKMQNQVLNEKIDEKLHKFEGLCEKPSVGRKNNGTRIFLQKKSQKLFSNESIENNQPKKIVKPIVIKKIQIPDQKDISPKVITPKTSVVANKSTLQKLKTFLWDNKYKILGAACVLGAAFVASSGNVNGSNTQQKYIIRYTREPKYCTRTTSDSVIKTECPYTGDDNVMRLSYIRERITSMNNDVSPCKVRFVTLSTPNRDSFSLVVAGNQMMYAQKHGYGFKRYDRSLDTSRPEEWSKIKALMYEMDRGAAEWLLWIDDDIMITNPSKTLESLIEQYGNNKEIIIAEDACSRFACKTMMGYDVPINNGIFLIKNTPWAKQYLNRVWQEGGRRGYLTRGRSLLEMKTMIDLMNEDSTVAQKMVILPQRTMNSFVRNPKSYSEDKDWSRWQPGDFAAHATGMPSEERKSVIYQLDRNPNNYPQYCVQRNIVSNERVETYECGETVIEHREHIVENYNQPEQDSNIVDRIANSRVWSWIANKVLRYSNDVVDNTPSYRTNY